MYSSVPISQQVPVYFRKFVRIYSRESAWKYVLFSGIIALIIGAICSGDGKGLRVDFGSSVFIAVSGCIWLGIFNTIQSVCKEHDIINSEYRQGMNLGAYVIAHVLYQMVLCFIQSTLMFVILLCFNFFRDINSGNVFAIYCLLYLLTFCSAILGLMISCIVSTPNTAMTVMPFLLIIQLLLGGYPFYFEKGTIADIIGCLTFSRWGVRGVGSLAGTSYMKHPDLFEATFSNTGLGFIMCIILAAAFSTIAYFALVIKNKKS